MDQMIPTKPETHNYSILRRIKGMISKDLEFPLKLNGERYPLVLNEEGYLRCPNCGDAYSLSNRLNRHTRCNTCFIEFYNYGEYGLELITKTA